ncbi:MAG: cytochrome-c peroxidase [Gemmatimonadaceae bacterium]
MRCASCHQPSRHGTDGLPLGVGILDRRTPRNVPTVLNAVLFAPVHWRGDRRDVEDQAIKALTGPQSGGNADLPAAEKRIRSITAYRDDFARAFPNDTQPVTGANFAAAIGAYERTLIAPSPFDAFLRGEASALSASARQGLARFMELGCASCHNGVGVGRELVPEVWRLR